MRFESSAGSREEEGRDPLGQASPGPGVRQHRKANPLASCFWGGYKHLGPKWKPLWSNQAHVTLWFPVTAEPWRLDQFPGTGAAMGTGPC